MEDEDKTKAGRVERLLQRDASRGEFIKWTSGAMGAMYAAPKVSTFSVQGKLGQAGSAPPGSHVPSNGGVSPNVPTGNVAAQPPVTLPTTGGGDDFGKVSDVLPEVAAGTIAAGVYLKHRANKKRTASDRAEETE